jgi:16S rRNA (adenine1518-N6/adenine1519-N6)-dimethyltransferase
LPPLDVGGLLRQHGLRPDKRLGQNFLIDPAALQRVVEAAGLSKDQAVLEVGAGLGSLTRYLAVLARQVAAVELDSDLIPLLETVLAPYPNVHILQGDILSLDPALILSSLYPPPATPPSSDILDSSGSTLQSPRSDPSYLVVANIPYYITSALIRQLLEARLRPERLVLTVQREVAERITAGPGEMSLLALSVQVYGWPRIMGRIPAGAFYPPPKVDSAVTRVDLYPTPRIPIPSLKTFFRLAKAGFSQKRKTLRNALAGGMHLEPPQAADLLQAAGIDPQRRAETLSLEEWGKLVEVYSTQVES